MSFLLHLFRSACAGAFVALAFFGLMVSDTPTPGHVGHPLVFAAFGGVFGIATAVLLLMFRVGPVAKVFMGAFCGPPLPVILLTHSVIEQGKAKDLGGLVFLCIVIGLLVGGLDASRVVQRRRAVDAA